MINSMERLVIAVVGAVSLVLVYGFLSMAWAGCTLEKQPDCYWEQNARPNHEATTTHYYQYHGPEQRGLGLYLYKSATNCEHAARKTHETCTKEAFRGPMPTKD